MRKLFLLVLVALLVAGEEAPKEIVERVLGENILRVYLDPRWNYDGLTFSATARDSRSIYLLNAERVGHTIIATLPYADITDISVTLSWGGRFYELDRIDRVVEENRPQPFIAPKKDNETAELVYEEEGTKIIISPKKTLGEKPSEVLVYDNERFAYSLEPEMVDGDLAVDIPDGISIRDFEAVVYYNDSIARLSSFDRISNITGFTESNLTIELNMEKIGMRSKKRVDRHGVVMEMVGENVSGLIRRIRIKNLTREGTIRIRDNNDSFAIDPTGLEFSEAEISVVAKGELLYKCRDWNFSAEACMGNWTLERSDLLLGKEFNITISPADPAFVFMRISACRAEDVAAASGVWGTACDRAYPGTALFLDDATYETHRTRRNGGLTFWAGLRINSTNATMDNCGRITSVLLCYKYWSATLNINTCDISVDANGGASYSVVTNVCPGNAEPARRTCANVTALESWSCSNFFGPTPTGALAKAELKHSGAGVNGFYNVNWDLFYFNVTYDPDTTPPRGVSSLQSTSKGRRWILWNWTNPTNWDFYQSIIYLNNTWKANTSNRYYNATGLSVGRYYTIAVRTKDKFGNVNTTNVSSMVETSQDLVKPTVTSLKASPDPVEHRSLINLSAAVTDDEGVSSVMIELEKPSGQKVNYTTAKVGDSYYNSSINITSWGIHSFRIYATDIYGNLNSSMTSAFTVKDTKKPSISFTANTRENDEHLAQGHVYSEVTAYDELEKNITFSLFGSTHLLERNITRGPGNRSYNFTSLGDGAYYHNVTIMDWGGNRNYTETRKITLDRISPSISYTINTRQDNSYAKNNWVYVEVSALDDNERNITFFLFDSGYSLLWNFTKGAGNRSQNFTALGEGDYYYNVSIYDKAGNKNLTPSRKISLDTTYPEISFTSETREHNSYSQFDWIYMEVVASDSNERNITFAIFNTTYSLVQNVTLGPGNRSFNFTVGEGAFLCNVTIFDRAGNFNMTETRKITLDNTFPKIEYSGRTRANGSFMNQTWVFVEVSVDEVSEKVITFDLDNGTYIERFALGPGNRSNNFTDLDDGTYFYNVSVIDMINLSNRTGVRKIILDRKNPSLEITSLSPDPAQFGIDPVTVEWVAEDLNLNYSRVQVTYPNSSVLGIFNSNITLSVDNLSQAGTYSFEFLAEDYAGNRNISVQTISVPDTLPPVVRLAAPINRSGGNAFSVVFNVSDSGIMENCTLYVNHKANLTNYTIPKNLPLSFAISNLSPQSLNFSIGCYDESGNNNETSQRRFTVIKSGSFSGKTTDLSGVDSGNIINLTLDSPAYGNIMFKEPVDLSIGADLDSIVQIEDNLVTLNSSFSELNKSAEITFYFGYMFSPFILKNGIACLSPNCTLISHEGNTIFNVTGFSSYSTGANSKLMIFDQADEEGGSLESLVYDQVRFYANYSNFSSGEPITGASCKIAFFYSNWTSESSMTYNITSKRYEYNRSFTDSGLTFYNITCNGSTMGYENLKSDDDIAIEGSGIVVQRGYSTIAAGSTGTAILAGTNYRKPRSLDRAFIRMTSTRLSGVGHNAGGGTQDPDEFMASIENPENLLSNITFRRNSTTAAYSTRVYWEIMEYIGADNGKNRFRVRDQRQATGTAAVINGTSVSVADDSDVVVFITGQRHNGAATATTLDRGLFTARWNATTDKPIFTRGDGTGRSYVSYAVVEFTGSNWKVQRKEHIYTAAGAWQNETITAVANTSRTFLHVQFLTNSGTNDEAGQEVYLSNNNNLSFRLYTGATIATQRAAVWVIENTESSGTPMKVQRVSGSRPVGVLEPEQWNNTFTAVSKLSRASVMGETGSSSGTGSTPPRGAIGLSLSELDRVYLWRSDSGTINNYRYEVVEWPIELVNFRPSIPTKITCNGTEDCSLFTAGTLNISVNGSVDQELDNITYYIEASLKEVNLSDDREPGTVQKQALPDTIYNQFYDDFSAATGFWSYIGLCARVTGDANCRDGNACMRCIGAATAGEDGNATATRDLSTYDECGISYYYKGNSLDAGECAYHRYIDTSQHTVQSLCDPADDNLFHSAAYNYSSLGYSLLKTSRLKYAITASGGNDYWYIDNVNLSCYIFEQDEDNSSASEYQDVLNYSFSLLDKITVKMNVTAYSGAGSFARDNNKPLLVVELYNGEGWTSIGTLNVISENIYTISTEDSSLLSAWLTLSNRDVKIHAINLDYYNSSAIDGISYNSVKVEFDGRLWTAIGNSTNTTSLVWNTSDYEEQPCVDLRARATDLGGSVQYSSYFTGAACIGIDRSTPNVTIITPLWETFNQSIIINITAYVADLVGIDTVIVNITWDSSYALQDMACPNSNGTFFSAFYSTEDIGQYNFSIYANDTSGKENTTGYNHFNIRDSFYPNITNITPKGEVFLANLTINITANVTDNYLVTSVYANITWSNGNKLIQMFDMDSDGIYNVSFSNTSWYGRYNITILANDTGGNIRMNYSFFYIEHHSYHYFYGNATGELDIGYLSSILQEVNNPNITNVYVADYDSEFAIADLKALGKKMDGTDSSYDFSEIDMVLSMANRSDSIMFLWGKNHTSPREMRNFSVYGTVIADVPVYNSTNGTTDFVTGIVWDTGDSLDDEFDSLEREDLVFIVSYNVSTGSYGSYGYEIRVPENLDTYKGLTGLVQFYVELS